jgi:PAP2 superfamily C-terminal
MWRQAFQNRAFKIQFISVIILLLMFLAFVPIYFRNVVEPRPGVLLNDFLLNRLPPADHSTIIFILIYVTIAFSLFSLVQHPSQLLLALMAYCAMNYLRLLSLWAFPLEPPTGIIPLRDPIIELLVYGGTPLLKDLFFSGHVATLAILAMVEESSSDSYRKWKLAKWTIAIAVGLLLMHQRVHYTVDVVAGVGVSVVVVRVLSWWLRGTLVTRGTAGD